MTAPLRLKLNKQAFCLSRPPAIVSTIRAFLDKAAKDEIFTVQGLAVRIKVARLAVSYSAIYESPQLTGYTAKVGNLRYWGHPRAIAELRKQAGL